MVSEYFSTPTNHQVDTSCIKCVVRCMNIQIIEEKSKYCYNFTSQQQLKYFKRDRDKIANSFSSQKFVNILCENFANIYLPEH